MEYPQGLGRDGGVVELFRIELASFGFWVVFRGRVGGFVVACDGSQLLVVLALQSWCSCWVVVHSWLRGWVVNSACCWVVWGKVSSALWGCVVWLVALYLRVDSRLVCSKSPFPALGSFFRNGNAATSVILVYKVIFSVARLDTS